MNASNKNITITDVARAAGASISTVSRVLSGSSYPVSDKNRETILRAASELGYEPNMLGAGRTATEYLISLGHQNIAFLSTPFNRESRTMTLDGYKLALANHNIPFSSQDILTVSDESDMENDLYKLESGRRLAEKFKDAWSRKPYTAIIAINYLIAYGIIQRLHEYQIRVPEDISIISFDNIPYSGLIDPPLTTIDMPARLLGQKACHLIVDSLNSKKDHSGITLSVGAELVIRKSVRPVRR